MASSAPPTGSVFRWALPLALFVAIIGGVAWVSQNLPKGAVQKPVEPDPAPTSSAPAPLRFLSAKAVWDANDPGYLKEFETGAEGHYDFPFRNTTDVPVTLGFANTACDCSQLGIVVLDKDAAANLKELHEKSPTKFPIDPKWQWAQLTKNDREGVQIPPGGGGVARIQWEGRRSVGQMLKLKITVWMHPTSAPGDRTFQDLDVPIVMADPIRFFVVDRLSLGVLGAGGKVQGELFAWSPTRDDLDLRVDPKKLDPLFDVALDKIDAEAAGLLHKKLFLSTVMNLDTKTQEERTAAFLEVAKATRYRSAFRIRVTLREQSDGQQLDQGPLSRELPVIAPAIPYEFHKPTITAYVRGDVDIGNVEDAGKINLSFRASDGVKKIVPLWSEGGNELSIERTFPAVLGVTLTKSKESTAARSKWLLEITIPPGGWLGPFLEDSVIFLRTTSPPRRIRIPVTGNAGQG
jgi:hypothetical protein